MNGKKKTCLLGVVYIPTCLFRKWFSLLTYLLGKKPCLIARKKTCLRFPCGISRYMQLLPQTRGCWSQTHGQVGLNDSRVMPRMVLHLANQPPKRLQCSWCDQEGASVWRGGCRHLQPTHITAELLEILETDDFPSLQDKKSLSLQQQDM